MNAAEVTRGQSCCYAFARFVFYLAALVTVSLTLRLTTSLCYQPHPTPPLPTLLTLTHALAKAGGVCQARV